jgi:hypothetical protein
MIVPGSRFRCGFTIESIASLLVIEQIPQLGGKIDARARSAWVGYTLYFANIPEITNKNLKFRLFSKRPGETCGLGA